MTTQNNALITDGVNDQLQRYLFAGKHARGELVQLKKCYQEMLNGHDYTQGVSQLLGELLVATSLLTATLKFEGEISVQLQGDGPVAYMVINGNMLAEKSCLKNSDNNPDKRHNQQMRGIAKLTQASDAVGLKNLIGQGTMVITIRPQNGEPYQGVVALEHETLAECLSHYFATSDQIPTKIWLFVNNENTFAAGSLVQLLPDGDDKEQQLQDFEHLCQLTNTIKEIEIFTLSASDLLYRLYHQEEVRLFAPQNISYNCGCSADKCLNAIAQIEVSEIKSILAEQGKITMTCDYCNTVYDFDETKLAVLINKQKH